MKEIENVLVLFEMDEERRKSLEEILPSANYYYTNRKELTDEELEKADVILGSLSPSKVINLKRLQWMQLSSAGSDIFQKEGFPEQAILTNATGGYGLAISEHMIGMLFMLIRKLHLYRDNQQNQLWQSEGDVLQVEGSTTLVIGMGDIGTEFAKRMKAMGSYVIGVRRSNTKASAYADEIHLIDDLDELLKRADIISLSVPETEDTRQILSRQRIELLKENAIILNVGRGTAIDTEALCDALYEHKIWGAGLDVTDPEPLPEGHRLWKAKNLVLTPHVSGGYSLKSTYNKILDICINNYKAFVNGEEMKNVVDFKRGY